MNMIYYIKKILIYPNKSKAKNLAFDITPAKYVTGLITEKGICVASEEALKKMLKDDKNKEYLDQIYFTISEIEIAEMDTIACINSLLNSTKYSLENDVQKSLSFYNLFTNVTM